MFETAYKRQIMKYGDLGLVVECKIVFQNKRTFRNLKERVFPFKVQNIYKKNSIFLMLPSSGILPCSPYENRRFVGKNRFHLQSRKIHELETSGQRVSSYTDYYYNSIDGSIHNDRCENLKSYKQYFCFSNKNIIWDMVLI
jgi:hypothetical protein